LQAQINLSSTMSFELREALLIYRTDRQSHDSKGPGSFVTKHPVTLNAHGAPSLGAGAPLGKSDVTDLLKQLLGSISVEFLPSCVLAHTQESIVWWTPPAVRPMFYAKEKGREVTLLSGKRFPQPGLIFRAQPNHLDVRAVACPDRPRPDTPLYRAPYWNVNDQGDVCLGTTRIPSEVAIASLSRWEAAFFESEFTHPNAARKLTEHPGGFIGLWTSLIGKRRFPIEHLADAKETLTQFLQR
jgi:PRTRC genetic system protein B